MIYFFFSRFSATAPAIPITNPPPIIAAIGKGVSLATGLGVADFLAGVAFLFSRELVDDELLLIVADDSDWLEASVELVEATDAAVVLVSVAALASLGAVVLL